MPGRADVPAWNAGYLPNTVPALVFDPDAYFGTMARLNQEIKESEAGKFLADNYGKTVSRRDFDAAFAKSWGKRERESS